MSSHAPNLDDLISLNQEIAALVRAGIPLELGLRGLSGGGVRLAALSDRLAARLANGLTLSAALAEEGSAVSPVYTAVIEAGLAAGKLPEALESLAISGRVIQETRRRVLLALLYPAICVVVAYLLFCGFVTFLIPQLEPVFEILPHNWVVDLVRQLHEYRGYLTLVFPAVMFTAVVLTVLLRDGVTRTFWNGLTSFRWLIGRCLNWAQFTELLALQVDHHAPLPLAFVLAADSTEDARWQREARDVSNQLVNGVSFAEALRSAVSLPPLVRWMMATGEKQGMLAETLRHLSGTYRRVALRRAATIKVWLPVMITICFTGGIGMAFGVAFFLPLRMFLLGLMNE